MKHLLKYAFVAIAALLTASSCTNDFDYEPASASEQGGNAYLTAGTTTFTFVPGVEQNIPVTIHRVDSTQAETITLTCDNEKFTVPATVEFAAGEKEKDIVVVGNVETGGNEKANIALSSDNAFLYAGTTVTVTVSVYRTLQGVMSSTWFKDPFEVEIYEIAKGNYMIPDCYDYGYDVKFTIDFNTNVANFPTQFIFLYDETYGRVAFDAAKGTYDPDTKLVSVETTMSLPDTGYSFNGTFKEEIMFVDDPLE